MLIPSTKRTTEVMAIREATDDMTPRETTAILVRAGSMALVAHVRMAASWHGRPDGDPCALERTVWAITGTGFAVLLQDMATSDGVTEDSMI